MRTDLHVTPAIGPADRIAAAFMAAAHVLAWAAHFTSASLNRLAALITRAALRP